jgi:hypothetical protein
MAHDPSAHAVVLFGGNGGPRGDTWRWNGHKWVLLRIPEAPGRFNPAMAWDPSSARLVRFGGWDGTRRTDDTWELETDGWAQVPVKGPSRRNHTVLVSAADRAPFCSMAATMTRWYSEICGSGVRHTPASEPESSTPGE